MTNPGDAANPFETPAESDDAHEQQSAVQRRSAQVPSAASPSSGGNDLQRLVEIADLPETLWRPDLGCLHLPPDLARLYGEHISRRNLTELSRHRSSNGAPVGGISQAETDAHFAQQFPGSVARAQLALLDPHGHILHVADALARQLTGGEVALLDLPSGAGALGLAFLCTIAELRASAVLPRHPLDVVLVGGEISGPARRYAQELLAAVEPHLAKQAIFVKHSQFPWDACDTVSTTRLIQEFLRASVECPRRLVAISNFSGFLHRAGKMREATPQLNDVFRLCSGRDSVAVWLEPHMNEATAPGGIFDKLVNLAREKLRRFVTLVRPVPAKAEDEPLDHGRTEANYSLPLTPEAHARVRLAVLQLDLSGGQ